MGNVQAEHFCPIRKTKTNPTGWQAHQTSSHSISPRCISKTTPNQFRCGNNPRINPTQNTQYRSKTNITDPLCPTSYPQQRSVT
eukprot:3473527-Amphidinium_carterae.1